MKLFFREFGSNGNPIVIVHGLYGCSDNWVSVAKMLSAENRVFAVDLRNHGRSPHSDECNYNIMCDDLVEFVNSKNIENPIFIGHSMGGRCVALLAKKYPHLVSKIILVDISPFDCEHHEEILDFHKNILNTLNTVDTIKIHSRIDVAAQISEKIKDIDLQNFLLKNLYKAPNGSFSWRFNISSILKNVNNFTKGSLEKCDNYEIQIPTLLLKGEKSNYVTTADIKAIKNIFTNLKIEEIAEAGHWLHAEKLKIFVDSVLKFINTNK